MKDRIILDLCGGTGAWSRPYAEAGYDVRVITLPEQDVRTYQPPKHVHGILAAPPCTEFAISGARWWKHKPPELLVTARAVVRSCLTIIAITKPQWWALENPVGRLMQQVPELGKWNYTFQPYEYGDPWTKRTCIWGRHNKPIKCEVAPVGQWIGRSDAPSIVDHFGDYLPPDWVHKLPPSKDRATLRSMTPPGFAKAFFEANR